MMFDPSRTTLPLNSRIDRAINRALDQGRLVGAVVLMSHGGRRVYQRAAGYMDREAMEPMRLEGLFRLASVTKLFMAVATLKLVDEGVVRLDDEVSRYLPLFQPKQGGRAVTSLTLDHLLSHTSGLGYGFDGGADGLYRRLGVSDGMDQPGLSLKDNLKRLGEAPLFHAPGARWRYSLGLDVLGGALEAATGQSLVEIIKTRVTDPLGLDDTGFGAVDEGRLVTPYGTMPKGVVPMTPGIEVPLEGDWVRFDPDRFRNPSSYPSGGAGLIGSAGDVMTLLEAARTGGHLILSEAGNEALFDLRVGPEAQTRGPGWGFGYGGGVLVDPVAAQTPQGAGTLAWGGVYGHNWFVDRAQGISVVCLTNTAFEGMNGQLVTDLIHAVYGRTQGLQVPATEG